MLLINQSDEITTSAVNNKSLSESFTSVESGTTEASDHQQEPPRKERRRPSTRFSLQRASFIYAAELAESERFKEFVESGTSEFLASLSSDAGEHKKSAAVLDNNEDETTQDRTKRVRFTNLYIREHTICLGDNPGGTQGPPVTIGWKKEASFTVSVDTYEQDRLPRRQMKEMQMNRSRRERILKEVGFSRREMQEGTKAANIVRAQRKKTISSLNMHRFHEKMENVSRGIRHVLTMGSQAKCEQELLNQYE
jgi:DNA relaxase NicK